MRSFTQSVVLVWCHTGIPFYVVLSPFAAALLRKCFKPQKINPPFLQIQARMLPDPRREHRHFGNAPCPEEPSEKGHRNHMGMCDMKLAKSQKTYQIALKCARFRKK
jgi:hypothetical protein